MKVTPLARAFGLRVEGVDVRNLSDSERGEIIRAGNAAGVVHIPGQSLSEAEQLEFTRLYGRVRVLRVNRARNSQRPPGIVEISNVDADGNIVPPGNDMIRFSKGNMMWHSDYSYTADWAAQSILHALEAASEGGETEWASTEAAYDALPEAEKARLSRLTATHDRFHSRIKNGFTDFTEEDYKLTPPVLHPLVTTHPVTGRKALLLGSHVSAIEGMNEAETEALVAELTAHCCQPEFVYSHVWTPGDIIVWDNRSTLHRGRPADPTERRVMRRTAVFGEGVEGPEVQVAS
ncbi:MAG: TauD/TfdA family dioxygenase [Boseongicola sp.]|nr:TauD/TfdA family dioxygenase [Boseongicola sp.]